MPDHAISILQATSPAQINQVSPLFDGYRTFYGQPSDLSGAHAFLMERFQHGQSVVFVAYQASSAVGFTQLYPSFSSVSLRRLWILNDLFVAATARRLGVGRLLLDTAKRHAEATNAKGLVLQTAVTNVGTQRLYEAAGWQQDTKFYTYTLSLAVP